MWIALIAITVSVLIGFMSASKLRTLMILAWWLAPLWIALWFTNSFAPDIEFEFGAWWSYLAFAPIFLVLWAVVTIFPFKLTTRLREIQRGH